MLPMIPFYATVYVKMKKWHKEGGLAAPFARGRLLCPCPLMSEGWVVELTDGKIVHVRVTVQPNMEAEELRPLPDAGPEVALQLKEEPQPGRPTHRVMGKQPPTSEPQVPGPPRASHPTTGGILRLCQLRARLHQVGMQLRRWTLSPWTRKTYGKTKHWTSLYRRRRLPQEVSGL